MRVKSLAPMRRGAEIPVKIQIPDRPDVVRCYGIVVWSSNTSGATGVRFVRLPDSDKQLLGMWLLELEKASKAPEQSATSFTSPSINARPLAPLPGPVMAPLQPPIPPPPTTAKVEVLPLAAAPTMEVTKPTMTSGTVEMPKPVMAAAPTVEMPKPVVAVPSAPTVAPTPKPVAAVEKQIVFVAPVRPSTPQPAKPIALEPVAVQPVKPIEVEPIAAPIRAVAAAPAPAPLNSVPVNPVQAAAAPVKPAPLHAASAAVAVPKPKPNFVIELPEHEGFDPTGKIALPPRIDEDEDTYKEYPSKRKWLVAAPIAAALIAVPFWFVRQHKAEPTVVTASAPAPQVAPAANDTVTVTSAAQAPKQVVAKPTAEVAAPVREVTVDKKAAVPVKAETKPEPAPIMLAASSSPIKRAVDSDAPAIAPSVAVSAVSANAVALPANATVPKLQAPTAPTVSGGALVKRVAPSYPANARAMHLEGNVELVLQVRADGSVGKVRANSGNPLLAQAATEAVKLWKYDPMRVNGVATETEKTVELKFVLPR